VWLEWKCVTLSKKKLKGRESWGKGIENLKEEKKQSSQLLTSSGGKNCTAKRSISSLDFGGGGNLVVWRVRTSRQNYGTNY